MDVDLVSAGKCDVIYKSWVTTPPIKKSKKSLTGFWGLKIEMMLLQLIVLFIGMPRSLQRISQGVTDFVSKNRF